MRFKLSDSFVPRASIAVALGLLAGVSGPALAGKPVDLVLALPAGTTLHYKLAQDTEGTYNGLPVGGMVRADLDVSRVDSEGENIRVQVVFLRVEASRKMGDEVQAQELGLDGMKGQAEITKHGKLVKFDAPLEATKEQQLLLTKLADAVFVELPPKPVETDDTWTIDLSDKAQTITGSGEYVLESVDTKDGVQVAKISGETKVQSETPAVTGKGRTQAEIAVPGGYPLLVKGSIDLTPAEGPTMTQSYEIRLETPK
jgi:hypothetical protein